MSSKLAPSFEAFHFALFTFSSYAYYLDSSIILHELACFYIIRSRMLSKEETSEKSE